VQRTLFVTNTVRHEPRSVKLQFAAMARSTRDRPAKAPLSRDAVIAAGMTVLRRAGLDAVTMRAVAAELDTGPASLYVYVANREQLLNEMFDAVAREVEPGPEPDAARWREQLEALLTRVRDAMDRHPGIARVPLANIPTGHGAMRIVERMLGILRAGGIPEQSAAWFVDCVFLYVNAASLETSIYVESGLTEDVAAGTRERFEQIDTAEYPLLASMTGALFSGDGDARFSFGLRLMIEGLRHVKTSAR
jgi:AcrR family transcriptional regulator